MAVSFRVSLSVVKIPAGLEVNAGIQTFPMVRVMLWGWGSCNGSVGSSSTWYSQIKWNVSYCLQHHSYHHFFIYLFYLFIFIDTDLLFGLLQTTSWMISQRGDLRGTGSRANPLRRHGTRGPRRRRAATARGRWVARGSHHTTRRSSRLYLKTLG